MAARPGQIMVAVYLFRPESLENPRNSEEFRRVVSPRTSDEEGARLRAGRPYYSEGLIRSPTEVGSPRVIGSTDDLRSCQSYYPCRCPTARSICLGDGAL